MYNVHPLLSRKGLVQVDFPVLRHKPSIKIVFVGDKDPNIQHQEHVH